MFPDGCNRGGQFLCGKEESCRRLVHNGVGKMFMFVNFAVKRGHLKKLKFCAAMSGIS